MQNKNKKECRIGVEKYNNQGCLMKCVEYYSGKNIVIEFQDDYKYKINSSWKDFNNGEVRNPFYPSVYNVGIVGDMKISIDKKPIKEYDAWRGILERCYDEKYKEKYPTYKDVLVCDEWLYYPNFYEWLHKQENFDKWYNGKRWNVDKDILIKGNKIYSPDTCCLVPQNVNKLFIKRGILRGSLYVGVTYDKNKQKYMARVSMYKDNKKYRKHCGYYNTPEEAFYLGYKPTKEIYIKQVAQEEYSKGNITKKCYDAMMNYEVEITD